MGVNAKTGRFWWWWCVSLCDGAFLPRLEQCTQEIQDFFAALVSNEAEYVCISL
jgi:hypothetical protein